MALIRFYLDENLPYTIAAVAHRLGLDVATVHDSGLLGASGMTQLQHAAAAGRVPVTRDVEDFVRATRECQHRELLHAGVVIVTRAFDSRDYAALAHALTAYAASHPDGLPPYMVDYLPPPDR